MCQTFIIDSKAIESIGDLKLYVKDKLIDCINDDYDHPLEFFKDNNCLCPIDPIRVALVLDTKVLIDPLFAKCTFIKRDYIVKALE